MKRRLQLAEALARGELEGQERTDALAIPAVASQLATIQSRDREQKKAPAKAGKGRRR
jgi:hypothetical protein